MLMMYVLTQRVRRGLAVNEGLRRSTERGPAERARQIFRFGGSNDQQPYDPPVPGLVTDQASSG